MVSKNKAYHERLRQLRQKQMEMDVVEDFEEPFVVRLKKDTKKEKKK